jgi:hypothetical protein
MRMLAFFVGAFVLMVADIAANHGYWTRTVAAMAHHVLSSTGLV